MNIIPSILARHRDGKNVPDPTGEFHSEWMNALAVEIEELVMTLWNARFALEYWEREARVCAPDERWTLGPRERGRDEITNAAALLAALEDTSGVERLG